MGHYNWNLRELCCIIPYNAKYIIQHSKHLIHRCYSCPSPPRPRRYPRHACRCPWICQRDQIYQCYHHHHHPRPRKGVLVKSSFISAIKAEMLHPLVELCIPRCSDLTIEVFRIEHNGHCTDKNKNNSFGLHGGLFFIQLYKVWFGSVV